MNYLRLFLLLALLTITACATTVPTVEEGWVPLDEWNHRIVHAPTPNTSARVADAMQRSGGGSSSTTVRTYCHSYKRYTRCSSYAR